METSKKKNIKQNARLLRKQLKNTDDTCAIEKTTWDLFSDHGILYSFPDSVFPAGTTFYRVRKAYASELIGTNDCWNPPKNIVNLNRFNQKNESILYISYKHPESAILEAKMDYWDRFLLIRYESIKQIDAKFINKVISKESKFKVVKGVNIINRVIRNTIMSAGNELVYHATNTIKKKINFNDVNSKEESSRALLYSSVIDSKYLNMAMNPEYAKDSLVIKDVKYCVNFFGYYGIGSSVYVVNDIFIKDEKIGFSIPKHDVSIETTPQVILDVNDIAKELLVHLNNGDTKKADIERKRNLTLNDSRF